MQIKAPAKINLYLRILKRRADGYHELRTVFQRIRLHDRVDLRSAPGRIRLKVRGMRLPSDAQNLAFRAAALLKAQYAPERGVDIVLEKNIPVQAGLGGGSSDAAAVLLGLNRLWRLNLSRGTLARLGASLGSDVPFFILQTGMAAASGRGEKLKPIRYRGPRYACVVVKPPFGISTRAAYSTWARLAPKLTPPRGDVKMLVRSLQKGRSDTLRRIISNSLELSLNKRVTTISKIKEQLVKDGALAALMSGSGSAVFGLYKTKKSAESAARSFRHWKRYRVFVTSTY